MGEREVNNPCIRGEKKTIYAIGAILLILFCAPFIEANEDRTERAGKKWGVIVSDAYVQEVPPVADNSAAYMEIKNGGRDDRILTAVKTFGCAIQKAGNPVHIRKVTAGYHCAFRLYK